MWAQGHWKFLTLCAYFILVIAMGSIIFWSSSDTHDED